MNPELSPGSESGIFVSFSDPGKKKGKNRLINKILLFALIVQKILWNVPLKGAGPNRPTFHWIYSVLEYITVLHCCLAYLKVFG